MTGQCGTSSDHRGLSPELLQRLACPACDERPPVEEIADGRFLQCTVCRREYPVVDGIPVMLVSEAVPASERASRPAEKQKS
ncbi:MAG: Trm112 family protein [Lentisphaeria bacterium]|nr:Trm112 family protein [Lentisphaeria bacterium]MDP7740955.1 Trm112 family protein [Lentisphaeria bacterium]